MKQLVKIGLAVLVLFGYWNTQAQNTGLFNKNFNQSSNRLGNKLAGEVYYFDLTENSNYFLNHDWANGRIVLKSGDVFDGLKLKYMAFGDELVVYNPTNKILFKVDKNTVKEFSFYDSQNVGDDSERTFINLDSARFAKSGFCEILYDGNVDFLVFHRITETILSVPYRDDNNIMRDNIFEHRNEGYLLTTRYGLVRMRYKNNFIVSYYPENSKEIKRQLRKNNIKVKNQASAAKAVELLDKAGLLK